jgi:hypothetical protein
LQDIERKFSYDLLVEAEYILPLLSLFSQIRKKSLLSYVQIFPSLENGGGNLQRKYKYSDAKFWERTKNSSA